MLINIRPKGKFRYKTKITLKYKTRDFLVVQWLGLCAANAGARVRELDPMCPNEEFTCHS